MNMAQIAEVLKDLAELALLPAAFAFVSSLIATALIYRFVGGLNGPTAMLPFAFAILGGVAGVITGSSMEPLVGALITGVLGIVSAVLSYAFAKETDPAIRAVIPAAIILLLLNALGGLAVGQNAKKKFIVYTNTMEEHRLDYKELWIPATREYQRKVMERCFTEHPKPAESAQRCKYQVLFPPEG
jgi:hypothetical protein